MHILRSCAVVCTAVIAILPSSLLVTTPVALADCTEASGITMCQNEVRRADTGPATQEIWYPYPCEYDYLCVDGVSVYDNDNNNNNNGGVEPPDEPGRPDIGLPGRPGDRPDRPGGGGGGGIGGGR